MHKDTVEIITNIEQDELEKILRDHVSRDLGASPDATTSIVFSVVQGKVKVECTTTFGMDEHVHCVPRIMRETD